MNEPVQMEVEVIWRKKCVSYIRWFEGVCSITEGRKTGQDCKEQMGVSYLQGGTFLDFTSGIHGNNVDGN